MSQDRLKELLKFQPQASLKGEDIHLQLNNENIIEMN